MRSISDGIDVRGSADAVWSLLEGFSQYASWNPFILEADGVPAPGSRLRVRILPPGGREMVFHPRIIVFDRLRELRWKGVVLVPGLLDAEHSFRIHPVSDDKVRFEQSESFSGILVPFTPAALFEQTRHGFELMNRALRERVEAGR